MPNFNYSKRAVSYLDEGAAAGRETLLLIPGLGGTMNFWLPVANALKARHRVLSFDHPGMGASEDPAEPPTVTALAQLSIALLDHLNIDRAVFVGHSMGGIISQAAALAHPQCVRALVLSSTWAKPDHYFQMAFAQRLWLLENGGPSAYARAQTLSVMPPEYIAAHPDIADAQVERAASLRSPTVMRQRINAILAFDGTNELAQIRQPVLIVYSDADAVVPAHMSRALADGLTGAAVKQELALTGGGHFSPVILPEAYCAGLRTFVDALP